MNRRALITSGMSCLAVGAASQTVLSQTMRLDSGTPVAARDALVLTRSPGARPVRVAVAVSDSATLIDFAGPWQVLSNVILSSSYDGDSPANPIAEGFHTFIVSKDRKPLTVSGAMKVIPDYSFRDAPQPNVILVGAQPDSPELLAWLKSAAPKCDIVASVCVGAYFPARAGMLDGRKATTHHDFYDVLAKQFPKVQWLRGPRWVEEDRGRIITAGGEASGMDLALRIVDRYYGDSESQRVKFYTELSTDTPRPA